MLVMKNCVKVNEEVELNENEVCKMELTKFSDNKTSVMIVMPEVQNNDHANQQEVNLRLASIMLGETLIELASAIKVNPQDLLTHTVNMMNGNPGQTN